MIGYLEGKVLLKDEKSVMVLVAGIGYRVAVSLQTGAGLVEQGETKLWTYLAVREDALDLYGFATRGEMRLFETLLKVTGIGPKTALNILSVTGEALLMRAIHTSDPSYLTKVSGIGKKTAEKIIFELKDKFTRDGAESTEIAVAENEALDALEALGYPIRDTREIVRAIAREHDDARDIVRKALQTLGK